MQNFKGLDYIEKWVESLLISSGVNDTLAIYIRLFVFILILFILCSLVFIVTKQIAVRFIYKIVKKTNFKWDDILADQELFKNVAHIAAAIIVRILAPTIFNDFKTLLPYVIKITDAYLIIVGAMIVISCLKAGELILSRLPAFKDKPLTSYFQLIRIIFYIGTGILILSVLLGKSPFYFLSAFGAMTAILLLVFKDTILGLVASVQMSSNDMVRVGDWVEMPKFNADGDVIAINLNTVKVQNFDKTITTIPTYYFISDSFKNWRGMVKSGGRRIKRSIFLDANFIRFIDAEEREKYSKYRYVEEYINTRQKEIESYNTQNNIDTSIEINGRKMTNVGLFRKYIENYLKEHSKIKSDMTIMVRQLATEDRGIPLEVYCFTNTIVWPEYESIQGDIFDHLFAATENFGLKVFQQPSGNNISEIVNAIRIPKYSNYN